MAQTGRAHWEGDLKTGKGTIALGSGAFEGPYSFKTRFEGAPGTTPEELLGAAHAGCFTMALSLGLTLAGHPPTSLDTTAAVTLAKVGESFAITRIDLTLKGVVPACRRPISSDSRKTRRRTASSRARSPACR